MYSMAFIINNNVKVTWKFLHWPGNYYDSEKEKNLQDTVNSALKQIEEKQYEQVLLEYGVLKKNICKYGFAFEGKTVLIG